MRAGNQETGDREASAQKETLVRFLRGYAHDGRHVLPKDFALAVTKRQFHCLTVPGNRLPLTCFDGGRLPIGNDEVAVVADKVTGRYAQVVAELHESLDRRIYIAFHIVV